MSLAIFNFLTALVRFLICVQSFGAEETAPAIPATPVGSMMFDETTRLDVPSSYTIRQSSLDPRPWRAVTACQPPTWRFT